MLDLADEFVSSTRSNRPEAAGISGLGDVVGSGPARVHPMSPPLHAR